MSTNRSEKQRNAHVESLELRRLLSGGDLPIGQVLAGEITEVGAQDQWTFDAVAGDTISTAATSTPTQAGFEAFFRLIAPSGTEAFWRWPGGFSKHQIAESGTYTIAVRDFDDAQTGKYSVIVESLSPVSPDAAKLIPGGIVSGTIDNRIDIDQWTLDGKDGDILTIASTSTATQAGFEMFCEVYAPSGVQVSGFWSGGRQKLTLEEAGTFTVVVRDYDSAQTGQYTIGLEGVNPISPNPSTLSHGGITAGSIDAINDVDQLTFSGKAGELFGIAMTSKAKVNGFDAFARVHAPSGTEVTGFFAGGQRLVELPEDGTYVIDVQDYDLRQTGSYTIGLESVNPPSPKSAALPASVVRSGVNEAGIDVDQFVFDADANDRFHFTLSGKAVDAGYDAFLQVFDESGDQVFSSFAGTSGTFTAPASGRYLVQVHDSDFAQRGKYDLRLSRIGANTGVMSGRMYHDVNGNGRRDANEGAVRGRVVWLDANDNGRRDAGETSTTTDFDGVYVFDSLITGKHVVRASLPPGYVGTTFGTGRRITLGKGQTSVTDFGVARPGKLSGRVFLDSNRNARRDAGERLLAGWTVFVDGNDNGRRDAGERSALSDGGGNWTITGVTPGSPAVRVLKRAGYAVPVVQRPRLTSGAAVSGRLLGVQRIA